jgi:hypothetical protein
MPATIPRMPELTSEVRYAFTGEVSERAELLNGTMQLELDGVTSDEEAHWELSISLAWRLGREGAIPLEEGDLALDAAGATSAEVVALLDSGSAEEDADTGNAIIEALFTIEESSVAAFERETRLYCQFEVGSEQWTGVMTPVANED